MNGAMKKSELYSMVGFLVGWGAPLGALILRYLSSPLSQGPYEFMEKEWAVNAFFYWYMMVGTCLAFTLFGMILGRHADEERERNLERVGS